MRNIRKYGLAGMLITSVADLPNRHGAGRPSEAF